MQTRTKVILAGGIIISMMAGLIFFGVSQTAAYYMTVEEFLERKDKLSDRAVKISGFIIGDSVRYDEQNLVLAFDIKAEDSDGSRRLPVIYEGIKPDTFIDGWETIIEGRLNDGGIFVATELLVKCPSKYEAEEGNYPNYENYNGKESESYPLDKEN